MATLDLKELANSFRTESRRRPDVNKSRRALAARKFRLAAKRKLEGISMFVPLAYTHEALESTAKWQLWDGSNQSAKTMHVAYKTALLLCGMKPIGNCPRCGGKALMVGESEDHLADPMWTKLAAPGAFDIIPDEITHEWRSVRPDPNDPNVLDPYDLAYKERWRPAPPLIPPRMIRRIAWEDRGKGCPRIVEFTTGWTLLCRSSGGKPPQGVQLNWNWIDEELTNPRNWISDLSARAIRFGGMNAWSVTPHSGGIELSELRLRADAGDDNVQAFTLLLESNPYMSPEQRAAFYADLPEDDRESRYYGRYAGLGRRVYPMFSATGIHGYEYQDIPENWCRYVAVDPGTQHCGTVFAAIDPDDLHIWVYDALDIRNANAGRWADEVYRRQGDHAFEAFIIDKRAGKQHPMGFEITVADKYWQALQSRNIKPRASGPLSGFFPGSPDVAARQECVLDFLAVRGTGRGVGTPRLKVARGRAPELEKQIQKAQMDGKRPDKRLKMQQDLLDALEYLVAYNPFYREPMKIVDSQADPVYARYEQFEKHRRKAIDKRQRQRLTPTH